MMIAICRGAARPSTKRRRAASVCRSRSRWAPPSIAPVIADNRVLIRRFAMLSLSGLHRKRTDRPTELHMRKAAGDRAARAKPARVACLDRHDLLLFRLPYPIQFGDVAV